MTLALGLGRADAAEEDARDSSPELFGSLRPPPPVRGRPSAIGASATVHVLAALLVVGAGVRALPPVATPEQATAHPTRLFLPSPASLKALGVVPRPLAPRAQTKDRISIGPPSPVHVRELVLHREDDLTRRPRGTPSAPVHADGELTVASPPAVAPAAPVAGQLTAPSRMSWPESGRVRAAPQMASRPLSAQRLVEAAAERALRAGVSVWGDPSGSGGRMGPLQFDPRGADFTQWIQHFKDEVYRNWVIPSSVMWGWGGRASFEFVVERDGALSGLHDLAGTGTPALDRAARNALVASRLLPLPADYAPSQVSMRVFFDYGPGSSAAR